MANELPPLYEESDETLLKKPFGTDTKPNPEPTPELLAAKEVWRSTYQPTEGEIPPEL